MSISCQLGELPSPATLSVRKRTSVQELPQVIGAAYQSIAQYLQTLGEQPAGPPFAAYYSMDMNDLDVELGFPTQKSLPGNDDIQSSSLPGGQAATTVHVGPYSEVEATYNTMLQWLKDNGYAWNGIAYEFYLNDPDMTPAAELRTEIFLPLKSK